MIVCWIIVTVIANISDMVLGWVIMNEIQNNSESYSIGQICGHEYLDATRLESSNKVATIRTCPCVLALLGIVLASSKCVLFQPRYLATSPEAHPSGTECEAKEPQDA